MGGVGEEILPPQRRVLRCTCCGDDSGEPGLESLTTVIFTDEPGGTRLAVESRVTQLRDFAADALAGVEQGWHETLHRLTHVAERDPAADNVLALSLPDSTPPNGAQHNRNKQDPERRVQGRRGHDTVDIGTNRQSEK